MGLVLNEHIKRPLCLLNILLVVLFKTGTVTNPVQRCQSSNHRIIFKG